MMILEVPPADSAHFRGHFPGRPILPGVAELALVANALDRRPLSRIALARFRQTVEPGQTLTLETRETAAGAVRVSLHREAAPVMNAELFFGDVAPPRASSLRVGEPLATAPLDDLLPQRPPMRFITGLLAQREDGADCLAVIPRGCALVEGGTAPALAVVEAAAQTAAMWEALRRASGPDAGKPRMGYLVALRDVVLLAGRVPAGRILVASMRLEAAAMPLTQYRAEVALDGETIMTGSIATALA
jgi:3-hydroxymyristoyl/3-hydroxydecanoyl-(acyl carrier protein) dehydratase